MSLERLDDALELVRYVDLVRVRDRVGVRVRVRVRVQGRVGGVDLVGVEHEEDDAASTRAEHAWSGLGVGLGLGLGVGLGPGLAARACLSCRPWP